MVGLCLLLQLILVWFQNHKGPKRVMLKEMLIVLTGMKPGWDAMHVANGAEQRAYASMAPDLELTFTRCVEMCFESVPGSVLTTFATLQGRRNGSGWNKLAIGSIVVSALTTGFGAATIGFE